MHDLVAADLRAEFAEHTQTGALVEALSKRLCLGVERYGQPLRAHNGRDAGQDLLEELLDAAVYARQRIEESSGYRAEQEARSIYGRVLLLLLDVSAQRAEQWP
jgi:hypothetical protein